jgi:hypothetical protein
VLRHGAADDLLDTYETERRGAARDNLAATEATMRFLAPHGPWGRAWRNLVLRLAPRVGWFRRRVDSGRLAEPARYRPSSIVERGPIHGTVAVDVPLPGGGRLRDQLGRGWVIVSSELQPGAVVDAAAVGTGTTYGAERAWLIRPDGYVAASAPLDDDAAMARLLDLVV